MRQPEDAELVLRNEQWLCRFNASGNSSTWSLGNVGRITGQRIFNMNSGTVRLMCAYKLPGLNDEAGVQYASFGGWAILPFTGVGSMEARPIAMPYCSWDPFPPG